MHGRYSIRVKSARRVPAVVIAPLQAMRGTATQGSGIPVARHETLSQASREECPAPNSSPKAGAGTYSESVRLKVVYCPARRTG